MKKLIFCFLISLIAYTVSAQEYGWSDISDNLPGDPSLSDVFFVSDNEGWITTSSFAEIYHTTSGGETFEIQTTQYYCNAIYMIDENEGYAGGANGRVYRTTDGGENWIAIGSISVTLSDIDFATTTQGYCCGDNGAIYSITPQGVENLNSGLASDLLGISAPSVNNVWICGGGQIVYYDGSNFIFQSGPVGSYNSIFFIDDEEGWVVGTGGIIGHTENSGISWESQAPGNPSDESLFDTFFLASEVGWMVGANGTIIVTSNGGENWEIVGSGFTTSLLRGVHFTSPTNGYIVGNNKTLLKFGELTSNDNNVLSGETMQLQNYPNPFNPTTTIQFSIQNDSKIELTIYNIKGQKINTLLNEQKQVGEHSIIWDGKDALGKQVSSGVYFYRLNLNDETELVKRCLLMK